MALRADPGSVLAFLPGAAEIRRTQNFLAERIHDASIDIVPLFGALDASVQDRAIAPATKGRRKVVLATSIAETSLTIEGVRIVVDSGLARIPRYEPDIGLTRLETVRASRAAVDQRRGRAGRTEPGVCYRLWDEPQTASFAAFSQPEILSADLSSLVLDLAEWGISDPTRLAFLDPPPGPALKEARDLLRELGALDSDGRITAEGRSLRALALPPRLARMIVDSHRLGAGREASDIAAVLTERGLGGDDVDLVHRLENLRRDRSPRGREARAMAARWAEVAKSNASEPAQSQERAGEQEWPAGALLALAYPERIAKNRGGGTGAFLLVNGRGATVDAASPLAREPYLAVAEMTGSAAAGRIVSAAAITLPDIETHFADRILTRDDVTFDPATARLRARRQRRLGALALAEQTLPVEASETSARVLALGVAKLGIGRLPWSKALRQWRDRVMFLRAAEGNEWPDLSDPSLAADTEWLTSIFHGKVSLAELPPDEFSSALTARLPYPLQRRLEAEAPTHFAAPTGTQAAIDYEAEGGPKIAIRVQELFGLDRHPAIAGGRVPLLIELLSPAHRPVQTTRDLPGFWRGSYAAVRSEMRGRYPKHPWPDDPIAAAPTRRAKPRTG
jgi:ATP-dependent helicase HrpB